jgi:hypothetical protein
MESYWKAVKHVIYQADVLLMVLDARFADDTRNEEIENRVRAAHKPLIYVLTKSDLVGRERAESYKKTIKPLVFISAREHWGRTKLKERIIIEAKACGKKDTIEVGVLGYPNVGKSSLINLMKGKHSASTSPQSGHTKSMQLIRADSRIFFIDTPGVIPYMEKDEVKHVIIGTTDFNKIRDPDIMVMKLMRRFPGVIESFYGVPVDEDKEKTLEAITVKKSVIMKGGVPDIMTMARNIIMSFQRGKIKANSHSLKG